MSFDIAKYPTLALVDSPGVTTVAEREFTETLRRTAPLFTRQREPFQRALRLRAGHGRTDQALHYVYNTPFDQLIWDVGHQAYPHKILTGRRDKIGTIRQKGGLHPFPWRGESEYDVLSVGHSSTSISAGIGIAVAAEKEGKIAAPSVSLAMARLPQAWRLKR